MEERQEDQWEGRKGVRQEERLEEQQEQDEGQGKRGEMEPVQGLSLLLYRVNPMEHSEELYWHHLH